MIFPVQPSQLLSLPPEVLVNVVANLPYSDLYRLALTAHCFYELSLGPLYASTTIQIGGVYWEREVSKLGNLIRNDTLRMRLRHLTVISIHGLLGYEVAVAELISLILTARPSPKLLSFTWKVRKMSKKTADILSYLEPGLRRLDVSAWTIEPFSVVHGLEELSYRRLTNDGVMWFSQQLRCVASTLKRLSVHVFSASHKDASKSLLRGLKYLKYNSCQLSHLRLSGVCLQGWDLGFIYSITSLCLLNCSEIDYYLSGWMDNYSYESRLEHLELVIPNGTSLLPQFLGHASAAQLKTLKVLLKSMTSFPLNVIQGNKLTTLVIEARRDIYDPKTVHPYTIDELVLVLNSFTNLVALGVPVHLELSEITQGLVSIECISYPNILILSETLENQGHNPQTRYTVSQGMQTSWVATGCLSLWAEDIG